MVRGDELAALNDRVTHCRRCPRLVAWREKVAREKRAAYADWDYWGRPVPGFGDPRAWLLVVGLAPAAHGANRTGRMFTGDRSGDFLYAALHRAGLANQPSSTARDDGLRLAGAYITAALRCAPPANQPTAAERANCREYLEAELDLLLPAVRVILALGGYAFAHVLRILRDRGVVVPKPAPKFGHGVTVELDGAPHLIACYHPSQQNTFTGKLTPEMLDAVVTEARELASG
ncbi:MAG: uracil-DNA glycosylase [Gammaproteobacteria bacterium]|uniref:Type-5 uracil-DNA glycosylase n=1 Tax=Candidatus Kutchimonas denitrificans TaxID=3056748 RepID=A0AAE4Z8U0_9BACT|nr:uracil-DNA glycosylase [Gemmatimonadota bacterium]NIR75133.1 uracil-DNA glycosylase [Candidatus Kutchimonas denitrificans]NIU52943.1 uracil-DNA glycosylase [Gemmatimonadota bacterium]NIV52412.1 uracil-DNA glycosylase [Gammaproteobacteria bacterium]NIY44832.1 uracil-DNA glycosylase [Gemmatimonadota bacterium]